MHARTILPTAYLGSVGYFAALARGGCVVDLGENWVKQTARNRAEILTAGGVATLTVPVHGHGAKIAAREVRIDGSKRWRHIHWGSIVAAYRAAPFFDHYGERFAAVYERRFDFLVDLNMELLSVTLAALGLAADFAVSEEYVNAAPADIDLRGKKSLRRTIGEMSAHPQYIQVFHDRLPFEPNLSVLDLLLCEGPSARDYLL